MTDTPLTPEELEVLDRLEKAATPGPWHHRHNPDTYDALEYFRDIYNQGQPGRIHLTCIPVPGKDVNDEALFTAITGNGPTSQANALLIAAARNALPALLAAASRERALAERVEDLEKRVETLKLQRAEARKERGEWFDRHQALAKRAKELEMQIAEWRTVAEGKQRKVESAERKGRAAGLREAAEYCKHAGWSDLSIADVVAPLLKEAKKAEVADGD